MKKKCQGFVLIETLIVAVFIVTIFTFLYTSVIPLLGTYEKLVKQDNIDVIYKLYHIRKALYEEPSYSQISNTNYQKITNSHFTNSSICRNNNNQIISCSETYYQKLTNILDLNNYDLVYIKYSGDKSIINEVINNNEYRNIKNYLEEEKDNITSDILILYDKDTDGITHLNFDNNR